MADFNPKNPFALQPGAPDAAPLGDVGKALFGGDNQVGFFGGGQRVADPMSYQLPGFQQQQATTQDQMYRALGMQQQTQQIVPGSPEWNAELANMSNEVAKGRMSVQQFQDFLKNGTTRATGATTPIAQPQDQFRGQQQQLADSLFGTISGQTPSVAQQQLNQTTQGNVANAYAMASSGRYNPAAARLAASNVGQVNQQAAGQGALLRAQEIAQSQAMLGNVLGAGRQQDIGNFGAQQGAAQGWSGQGLQAAIAQMQAQIAREQQAGQNFAGAQQNALGGKILSAAGSIGGAVATGGASAARSAVPQINLGQNYAGLTKQTDLPGYALGGHVVPGYAPGGAVDDEKYDKVHALLTPGEIVLPRSVTKAADAPELAKAFVAAIGLKKMKRAA